MNIHPIVTELKEECSRVRRELHRIPELGFEERKTQAYLMAYLEKLQPDSLEKLADTGIKAVFYADHGVETVAFRADMDGIRVSEGTRAEYSSEHPGKMHACGHDGHMAMMLMLARLVSARRSELRCHVVFLFQPAEEGRGGAKAMVEQGALQSPRVDRIYGMHLWPAVPAGKVGLRWGPMMAQTCEFDIVVHGRSAHGASPQMGVDAIVASAELIGMLQAMIARTIDPHQDALLTIGRIDGGSARNVIADRVEMNGTFRTFSNQIYDDIVERIENILRGLEMATGAKAEFVEKMRYPCVDNPRYLVEQLYDHIPKEDVIVVEPVMAAEDFSYYQQHIPGLFLFLGVGDEEHDLPLHHSRFDFDEKLLLGGIEICRRLLCME